jgi:GMP synthase (glutamine-hydrolysing)
MQNLRIHHLQHVPFESIGMIKDWMHENNVQHTATHLYNHEVLPDINDFDWLLVMGGPMSVNDEEEINWLNAEKEFIKQTIAANKTVIGICLGAQLIANVLGAKVYKNKEKEIGFFPIEQTVIANEAKQSVQQNNVTSSEAKNLPNIVEALLNNQTVFHWHGETFDLPENAVRLASSEACINQAFLYKENVLGLQFHLEMDEAAIEKIIENCRAELVESKFIQSEETIRKEMKKHIPENRKLLFELLDTLL